MTPSHFLTSKQSVSSGTMWDAAYWESETYMKYNRLIGTITLGVFCWAPFLQPAHLWFYYHVWAFYLSLGCFGMLLYISYGATYNSKYDTAAKVIFQTSISVASFAVPFYWAAVYDFSDRESKDWLDVIPGMVCTLPIPFLYLEFLFNDV